MNEWSIELRQAREVIGITRADLGALAHVSASTIKAYEVGTRHPSRHLLAALLNALKVERPVRTRILVGAGFASDADDKDPDKPGFMFSLDEARTEIERYDWPIHINSETMEVLAANRTAQKLWRVDLSKELNSPVERNMLSIASLPRFADKVENWDEAIGVAISVLKGHHLGPETMPEGTSAYFGAVVNRFMQGDPALVGRFFGLWQHAAPIPHKIRWTFPIVWNEPGIGRMNFRVFVSQANGVEGTGFVDWIPQDADSWSALETIRKRA